MTLDPADQSSTADDLLNELVAQCLDRLEEEGEAAIDALCAEHPQHASLLRRRLEVLRDVGLFELAAAPVHDFPERLGDFRLIQRLGSGGMGVVFLAEQESLQRPVALKLVRPDQLYFEGARLRFQREVEAAAKLQHPGIVPVYTVGEEDGIPFFAMERVEGTGLDEVLRQLRDHAPARLRGGDLRAAVARALAATGAAASVPEDLTRSKEGWVEACFRVVLDVARALEHAHSRGVIHRDVKPSNVMLTLEGRAMLVDFGLSSSRDSGQLTRSGTVLGSLPYMAPEQLEEGRAHVDERADVYSLGVTLYEVLGLQRPYLGKDADETTRLIHRADPPALRSLNPQVPWDAETVCLTAMDPSIERRYPTARAFAEDLEHFLEHRPIQARRPGPVLRARRWVQRHPTLSVGALAAALLFVSLALFAYQQRSLNQDLVRAQSTTENALAGERAARVLAEDHFGLAERHFGDVVRLADLRQLEQLRRRQRELWPVHPDLVPDLQDWVAEAELLVANLPRHRESLARLQEGGRDEGGEVPAAIRLDGARRAWLQEGLRELVDELQRFDDPQPVRGNLAELRDRLQRSSTIQRRSIEDHADAWDEAIDEVFLGGHYGELEIEPQIGLVPLGPDPESGLMEFWLVESGTRPERSLEDDALVLTPESGLVLVLIPGGSFHFGAQKEDPGGPNWDPRADVTEGPVCELELPTFLLSKYEVTQAQWQRVMGANPSFFQSDNPVVGRLMGDNRLHPVEQIGWDDGREFFRVLGLAYPTEAHWEYACRAGTDTPWEPGSEVEDLKGRLNLSDQSSVEKSNGSWDFEPGFDDGFLHSTPVGHFPANGFGLHDMHGNTAEFCATLGKYAELDPDREFPLSRDDPGAVSRVVRGGRFNMPAVEARSANREYFALDSRNPTFGLRPARRLD